MRSITAAIALAATLAHAQELAYQEIDPDRRVESRQDRSADAGVRSQEGTLHWSFGDGSRSRILHTEPAAAARRTWWQRGENGAWSDALVERALMDESGSAFPRLINDGNTVHIAFADPCAHDLTVRIADPLGRWPSYLMRGRAERGQFELPVRSSDVVLVSARDHGAGRTWLLILE